MLSSSPFFLVVFLSLSYGDSALSAEVEAEPYDDAFHPADSWLNGVREVDAIIEGQGQMQFERNLRSDHHRQLRSVSWSWTNILFHIGVCEPNSSCPNAPPHPGPLHCGCPDCNKPHPPHFMNDYCENLNKKSSSYSSSSSSESSSNADSSGSSNGSSSGGSSGRGSGGRGKDNSASREQSASRIFKPLLLILGAAAVAGVLVGILMRRKRKSTSKSLDEEAGTVQSRDVDGSGMGDPSGDYNNLADNVSAVFQDVLAGLGVKDENLIVSSDPDLDGDSLQGSVSRRLSLLKKGSSVSALRQNSTPAFIDVPSAQRIPTSISASPIGIEVEGPAPRPSNYSL